MHVLLVSILVGVAQAATPVDATASKEQGNPHGGDRAPVRKFLKEHVLGKTLATPKTTYKWDNNKMEGDYEDQVVYNNFTESTNGFAFDVTTVAKQTLYDLDAQGKRLQPGRDFSGVFVLRYEIGERVSTKQLTGIARPLAMTIKAPSAEGTVSLVTGMKIAEGKLIWNETLPGYADMVGAHEKYKPGTWSVKVTMALDNGKLNLTGEQVNYDVDPATLQRTPTKEQLPVFVTREIDRK